MCFYATLISQFGFVAICQTTLWYIVFWSPFTYRFNMLQTSWINGWRYKQHGYIWSPSSAQKTSLLRCLKKVESLLQLTLIGRTSWLNQLRWAVEKFYSSGCLCFTQYWTFTIFYTQSLHFCTFTDFLAIKLIHTLILGHTLSSGHFSKQHAGSFDWSQSASWRDSERS